MMSPVYRISQHLTLTIQRGLIKDTHDQNRGSSKDEPVLCCRHVLHTVPALLFGITIERVNNSPTVDPKQISGKVPSTPTVNGSVQLKPRLSPNPGRAKA